MENRILVRQPGIMPGIVVATLGTATAIIGIVLLILPNDLGPGLTVVGLLVIALGIGLILREYKLRVWARVAPNGFEFEDRSGIRTVRDDQIIAMAHQAQTDYVNGVPKTVTRTTRLWALGDEPPPELIRLQTRVKIDHFDPLSALLERLSKRLLAQAQADRAAKRKVLGELWALEGDELTLSPKSEPEVSVDLKSVVAVDVVERKVCIWQRGEESPIARIAADSANAHLLLLLLQERLAASAEESLTDSSQLGRVIFERKSKRSTIMVTICVAIVLTIIAAVMLFAAFTARGNEKVPLFLVACCALAIAALCAFVVFYLRRWQFRCHQHGVYYRGLRTERQLLYSDVEELTYSATRHYHNGAYVGTHFHIDFTPSGDANSRIRYSGTMTNVDEELENLRDLVARQMAGRWATRFARGEVVQWTPNLTFQRAGIEYRPSGWFGRKESGLLRYDRIAGMNLGDGKLGLFEVDQKKPVMTESTSVKNFFPGYYLLGSLLPSTDEQVEVEEE